MSRNRCLPLLVLPAAATLAGLAAPAAALSAVVTLKTVRVHAPRNPSVAVVPFTDGIYRSCAEAPDTPRGCETIGRVNHRYGIGQVEVTVRQWVAFLNTVDPDGRDRHRLYDPIESSSAWPKYGQIDMSASAPSGKHYSVAHKAWADKPYGFANFARAARFVNSLDNGRVLARRESARGGGTHSYWKYPTNPGVFDDGVATAPAATILNASTGDVTNAATQPLATYHPKDGAAPTWCPAAPDDCATVNPFGLDPDTYARLYQGSLSTVGQARTASPWGTLDQGGNAVEWTDTITAPPVRNGSPRVWRRMHGGVPNAPAYQMWPSAIGLQPQDNEFVYRTYPWLGFRIGVTGGAS